MLRFTLHRPSQSSAVSTCCHGRPCRDVPGRVHVGVRPVPASHTYEGRLALATLRCDVLAGITGLRRVRSFHFFDPPGCLLLQPGHEQTPTGLEDAPVESGLGCDVPARLFHGSGSGASHGFDVEVLDPDHVEPAGEVGGGSLNPVFAPVAIPGFQLCDQGPDFPAAVRPAPGTGEPALQPQERLGFLQAQPSRAGHLTSGQRHRDSDTTVNTHDAAGAGCGHRFGDHSERDMPTARPVGCDAVRLPVHEGAAASEPTPADLRDQHTAAGPVVAADPHSRRPDDPQTLMLAGFTPRRAPVGPSEEAPPPLVKVPQRLLLDRLRPGSQPRLRSPCSSQLCGLGVETRRGPLPPRPHQSLLQAEVPHVPGVSALLGQEHLLCNARIQAEPHGTQRNLGHRHPCGSQSPILGVVAAPPTCTSTWCSPPTIAAACSTRRYSTGANSSSRRCARTSGRPWPSSTGSKTMCTCSRPTRRRWRSATSSAPSTASRRGDCDRTSPAGSTGLGCAACSGLRHTSPGYAVARRCPHAGTYITNQKRPD